MIHWLTLAQVEKTHILTTLEKCLYDVTAASKALDVPKSTLYRKLNTYTEFKQLQSQRNQLRMGNLFK